MLEDRTCVVLGADEALNVSLLRAALRNPGRRIVIGAAVGLAADFICRADAAIGGDAFEQWPADADLPNDDATILLDGRRAG